MLAKSSTSSQLRTLVSRIDIAYVTVREDDNRIDQVWRAVRGATARPARPTCRGARDQR